MIGKVQGVGYRYFAMQQAKYFGIKGYVKNTISGAVEIEAEGEEEILDKFVSICRNGPGWAHVEKVEYHTAPCQSFKDFCIKH